MRKINGEDTIIQRITENKEKYTRKDTYKYKQLPIGKYTKGVAG